MGREAVEADKKAAVALPASGKCSIPAKELKLEGSFVDFMSKNDSLRGLIDTGKGNLQWEIDIPPAAFPTWRVLPPRTSMQTWDRSSMTFTRLPTRCSPTCLRVTTRREPSTDSPPRL